MKATDHLTSYGVTPRLKEGGKIGLQGVGSLPENIKAEVVTWARDNRAAILQELNPDAKNEFTKKGAPAPPPIEPMTECLHGKRCPCLDGPGERRPVCSKADAPVFDLDICPLHKWAKQQPKLAASPEPTTRNKTKDTRQQQVEAGRAVVANIKTDARLINWAKENKSYTYIGRGSVWGNSHRIGKGCDRGTACLKYAEGFGRFHEIDELKGRVLGCYCYPEQCHGDFLVWWANGPTAETLTGGLDDGHKT